MPSTTGAQQSIVVKPLPELISVAAASAKPLFSGVAVGSFMKTQGEIECAISKGMNRFEQEYMCRGLKDIHCHLINDLLVVRLIGVIRANAFGNSLALDPHPNPPLGTGRGDKKVDFRAKAIAL